MRTKQWVTGLNNNQRIRAIVNGVGYFTTVREAMSGPFTTQNGAMYSALLSLSFAKSEDNSTGIGRRIKVYDDKMQAIDFDIQIDLI